VTKSFMCMARCIGGCFLIAALVSGTAAIAQMPVDDMEEMMVLMGAGLERPIDPALRSSMPPPSGPSLAVGDVITLDFPGASATRANGINETGDIVGSYVVGASTWGYVLRAGRFTSLQFPGSVFTEAWGIDANGDIIGRYRKPGDSSTYGFQLSGDQFTDISTGHMHTLPTKITAGDVAGCFHDTNSLVDMRGIIQRARNISRTFNLLPSTMHNRITSEGMIVGLSFDSATMVRAYLLTDNAFVLFDFPGATFTEAWDANAGGKVVGYYGMVLSHGFVLDGNVLDSAALKTVDVPGAMWTRIFGINAQGDMVGNYADVDNQVHGFLLRDETSQPTVTGLTFTPSTVGAGASYTARLSGSNLTDATYFDLRFRRPGSAGDEIATDWQQGTSGSHLVATGTAFGNWTVTGVRAHKDLAYHGGTFTAVSATLTVSPF
jgi:hypothetical protein